MKILVLGGTGLLGHKMFQVLSGRYPDTWCTVRERRGESSLWDMALFQSGRILAGVDASNLETLDGLLREVRPEVIVNCVGAIKQRPEAQQVAWSITLNALLPHRLAAVAAAWGGRIIHFSTDCVFSGTKGRYTEDDDPDPVDLYGRTKVLGEVVTDNALTLRTSFIGRELRHCQSLLEWFIAQKGRKVRGYRRVWWSGVTSNHLGEVVGRVIANQPTLSGLYQLAGERISKHELLLKLREGLGLGVEIEPSDDIVCDRSLDGSRFAKVASYQAPSWDALIGDLIRDPTPYSHSAGAHAHSG